MKTFHSTLFTLLFLLTAPSVFSQTQPSVEGKVIEYFTNEPVEYVSVLLYQSKNDSVMVQGTTTDSTGKFRLPNVSPGEYFIQLSFIGFKTKNTKPFSVTVANRIKNIGKVNLELDDFMIKEIEVTEKKATYNLSIDRKVYNVGEDLMSETSSVSELLQNLPSVNVDYDGTVTIRGTPNITYFINGRPSALLRTNPKAALQSIPANSIERIEVITNPSAKYRPDGVGGIINIVLKEQGLRGLNGTISASAGNLARYNGNLTTNYSSDGFNAFVSYGFRHENTPRTDLETRIERDGNFNPIETLNKNIEATYRNFSHLVNAGIEYEIGDNDLLEISGNYFYSKGDHDTETTNKFFNGTGELTDSDLTIRTFDEPETEYEIGAAWEHSFEKEDHTLAFEFVYANVEESEDSYFNQKFSFPSESQIFERTFLEVAGPTIETALDYTYPFSEDTELELGYQGEFLSNTITSLGETFTFENGPPTINPLKTSEYKFDQNIHAVYATFGHAIDAFSFLAGLRYEQALVTGNLISSGTITPNDYNRFYPTLHLGYELGDFEEIQLSYSKRVNRADSDEQNPAPEWVDLLSRDVGNPLLKPEQIHSVELSYRLQNEKFTFLPSLYYRYKQDGFTEIERIVDVDSIPILETTFTNLATETSAGLEFILTTNIKDFMKLNFSANGFYNEIDASNLGFSNKKSNFTWDAKVAANMNITKSTVGQLNAYYRSSRLTPQGQFDPVVLMNLGFRQEILKKRAYVTFTISDVFSSLEFESVIDTKDLYQNTKFGRNAQIFYLGLTYNFGTSYQKDDKPKTLQFTDEIEAGKKAPEEEEE